MPHEGKGDTGGSQGFGSPAFFLHFQVVKLMWYVKAEEQDVYP